MAIAREEFSSQAAPELREIARTEGRHFPAFPGGPGGRDAPLHREPEPEKVRQEVMAHFQASVERNRRLGQLPADS